MTYFHAVVSANQDRPVFADPVVFLDVVNRLEAVAAAGTGVAAYVVMSSHAHFLLDVEADALGSTIQAIAGPVARGVNRRLDQRGGVFRPTWRRAVTTDADLWSLPLYIHANVAPAGTDASRLDVGLRSSHRAYLADDFHWLTPGLARDQYAGDYPRAVEDFLVARAARLHQCPDLDPALDALVCAVARVTGARPTTLLDDARGGRRDRMLLAWAIAEAAGPSTGATALRRTRQTVARWAAAVAADPTFDEWRRALAPAADAPRLSL